MGISKDSLVEVGKIAACPNTGWEHVILYAARHDGALRFPCSEIESVQWFPLEVIQRWIAHSPQDFASGFIECWKMFRRSSM
jgi:16S rRNA (adenine1518-N6/adenine1519-N6)-dimethyltransferase